MPTPTTWGPSSATPVANDYVIDALTGSRFWGTGVGGAGTPGAAVNLTYSFPVSSPSYFSPAYSTTSNEPATWIPFTASQQAAALTAMQTWANVAQITLTPVADDATTVGEIRVAFTNIEEGSYAWAYYPGNSPLAGDVWLNGAYVSLLNATFTAGDYPFYTIIHELGHALGLSHPFGHGEALSTADDTRMNSVMSYTTVAGFATSGFGHIYPTTPMPMDVEAIQYLYGANTAYNSGATNYVFQAGQYYLQTIWDGGGDDTITFNSVSDGSVIDLVPGHWSNLGADDYRFWQDNDEVYHQETFGNNVNIYQTVVIENAVGGGGADSIIGNDVANVLEGGGGSDTILGGGDADSVIGGGGADRMEGNAGNDSILGGPGDDWANGGDGIDFIIGNLGSDTLEGDLGGDSLVGAMGFDFVNGGSGNDFLEGNLGYDSLLGGDGNDTLLGGNGNDTLKGNAGEDSLEGAGGNDTLEGNAGNDYLVGGPGSDRFVYNDSTLGASDTSAAGHDTIIGNTGDSIDLLGLLDELRVNGTFLNVSGNVTVGVLIDANNDIAFAFDELRIDVTNDNTFNPADDFYIYIRTATGSITGIGFETTDDLLYLG